ncbi:Resolvase domain-containing protein [Flavobacterium cauense R2A-7]|uniref:DNA invertase Pin-like site-specific DNA recombinase n=1 Tax=Flavobacterium cauense R2A-7 TaxID=1341154 RepID=V6RY72_9FLAO|nr:recombinase family protein [Flavobacterium cauense]ESU19398.1 Resolvase domain-containing protein [Flavobacterium cauense R2A-7]KGO80362.1 transposase [Flavobacterium cauense R2A-7]TWI09367.1 DNA invertase Pin-like site-specific DNA recombinase [Flavobacterium cauense R2A-7]
MAKVKYVRVSTTEQNTGRQETNSKEFSKVYIDKVSGSVKFSERKEASKLISDIESGIIKEIHINSIDRLGRSIIDILTMIEFFNEKSVKVFVENIGMYSLIDGKPNPSFKMIVSVLGNVAEMERNNMLERQKQGIELAKAKGTYKGRLYGTRMNDDEVLVKYKAVVKELKNGESLRRAAKIGSCSLGTAQKIQRILQEKEVA